MNMTHILRLFDSSSLFFKRNIKSFTHRFKSINNQTRKSENGKTTSYTDRVDRNINKDAQKYLTKNHSGRAKEEENENRRENMIR